MRLGLLGRAHHGLGVALGAVEDQVQQHGRDGGQHDAGLDQDVDGVGHPLQVVERDDGKWWRRIGSAKTLVKVVPQPWSRAKAQSTVRGITHHLCAG